VLGAMENESGKKNQKPKSEVSGEGRDKVNSRSKSVDGGRRRGLQVGANRPDGVEATGRV